MSALPDLHGWLPAAALSRSLGVHPSTVRKRAKRGDVAAIPNPAGAGALYHGESTFRLTTRGDGGAGATEVVRAFSADDRAVLAVLPSSGLGVARELGIPPGTADRRLRRLERAGLVSRGETLPSGPRGGRPQIVWRVV